MNNKASEKLAYEQSHLGCRNATKTDNRPWLKGEGSIKTDAVSSVFDVGRYQQNIATYPNRETAGPAVISRWTLLQTKLF